MKRRRFAQLAASTGIGLGLAGGWMRWGPKGPPPWHPAAVRQARRSRVLIARCTDYDAVRLEACVRDGLEACGLDVSGRRVVIKPNFVEFDPRGVINTHPVLVAATTQVLRRLGARSVTVAEGPGHRRDNGYLLMASGLLEALRDIGAPYTDLNRDRVREVVARASFSPLGTLWLPETILDADVVISMPKLKTHHWAGVTLSMKNLFGIMPGAVYGWPKNVLHWAGIEQSILDISATMPRAPFTIVDGIVGMEGNGPIQGTAVAAGVLLFGADPVAVDATATRVMGLLPERIPHIAEAGRFHGNSDGDRIEQIGETIESVQRNFAVLPRHAQLRRSST
jgi:uncharacterized protein (DUF362 family)